MADGVILAHGLTESTETDAVIGAQLVKACPASIASVTAVGGGRQVTKGSRVGAVRPEGSCANAGWSKHGRQRNRLGDTRGRLPGNARSRAMTALETDESADIEGESKARQSACTWESLTTRNPTPWSGGDKPRWCSIGGPSCGPHRWGSPKAQAVFPLNRREPATTVGRRPSL